MLRIVAILVAIAIVVVLLLASREGDTFQVQRTADIQAPPERVYETIADFHRWPQWSPWEKLDPAKKRNMSGAAQGKGAVYAWDGNKQAGAGRMEIVATNAPSHVGIQLDFIRPFKSRNAVAFDLQPNNGGTHVVWSMSGPNTLMTKVMHVFIDMDKMIGKDFETGLANLKAIAEQPAG